MENMGEPWGTIPRRLKPIWPTLEISPISPATVMSFLRRQRWPPGRSSEGCRAGTSTSGSEGRNCSEASLANSFKVSGSLVFLHYFFSFGARFSTSFWGFAGLDSALFISFYFAFKVSRRMLPLNRRPSGPRTDFPSVRQIWASPDSGQFQLWHIVTLHIQEHAKPKQKALSICWNLHLVLCFWVLIGRGAKGPAKNAKVEFQAALLCQVSLMPPFDMALEHLAQLQLQFIWVAWRRWEKQRKRWNNTSAYTLIGRNTNMHHNGSLLTLSGMVRCTTRQIALICESDWCSFVWMAPNFQGRRRRNIGIKRTPKRGLAEKRRPETRKPDQGHAEFDLLNIWEQE